MISPVAVPQLIGRNHLLHILWVVIEHEHEGLITKAAHLLLDRLDIVDGIAIRDRVGLHGWTRREVVERGPDLRAQALSRGKVETEGVDIDAGHKHGLVWVWSVEEAKESLQAVAIAVGHAWEWILDDWAFLVGNAVGALVLRFGGLRLLCGYRCALVGGWVCLGCICESRGVAGLSAHVVR